MTLHSQRDFTQTVYLTGSDDSTGNPRTGVASGLGFVVIWIGMHDQSAPDQAGGACGQGNAREVEFDIYTTLGIGLQGRQITSVVVTTRGTMGFSCRVEVASSAHPITAGAVPLFMHMKTMVLVGFESTDGRVHHHMVAMLMKHDRSSHSVATRRLKIGLGSRALVFHAGASTEQNNHRQTNRSFNLVQTKFSL